MENRLYVGNLSDGVSIEALRRHFAAVGSVVEVKLATDRASGRMRGHALVTMGNEADARSAKRELNGTLLDERPLRVGFLGEVGEPSDKKAKERAKITLQFRERSNMVYELDCEGVSLAIRIFPDGPQEQSWRMEASARGATGDGMLALSANGTTRAAALEELSRMWRENDGLTRAFGIDWTAVASALAAVRAV